MMPRLLVILLPIFCVFSSPAAAQEPDWREEWQKQIIAWLKTVQEEEVAFTPKALDWTQLDPNELQRTRLAMTTGYPPFLIALAAMELPAEAFVWKGIWKPEDEAPTILTPYGVTKGTLWRPTTPASADSLAWLYSWNRPWNSYYGDVAMAKRAAIISLIDLVMIRENVHYYTSGEAGCRQPRFPPRACESGFLLTFNAYCFYKVHEALPAEIRQAWAEGLRWYSAYNIESPFGGPENMQLSVPVGLYYAALGLKDDDIKAWAEEKMYQLMERHWSPAGYIRDAGVPDGSYNGISMHRLAEYWGISRSPKVLEKLRQAYALRQHLVLPEPDGGTLSPSHFNARCKDGFDIDQYSGRESILLQEIPDAAYFYRKAWSVETEEKQRAMIGNFSQRKFTRLGQPAAWENNHRWDAVMTIPNLEYHAPDEIAAAAIIQEHLKPVIQKEERYSRSFGDEFFVIRRPRYAAIFYAGPAVTSDSGATNHHAMLKGEGGHLMGFAGGGLSAFWTPSTSSVMMGRLTGYETYHRKVQKFQWGSYILSDWRDWLSNHVVGETPDGKIITSARTTDVKSTLAENGEALTLEGTMLDETRKQGKLTDARISYRRQYDFHDYGIACSLDIFTDQAVDFKELYEALPLLTGRKVHQRAEEMVGVTSWRFLNKEGEEIAPDPVQAPYGTTIFEEGNLNPVTGKEEIAARVRGVHTVEVSRYEGKTRVVFDQPVNLALLSVEVISVQATTAYGRALLIELPTRLEPGQPVSLRYQLLPGDDGQAIAIHP